MRVCLHACPETAQAADSLQEPYLQGRRRPQTRRTGNAHHHGGDVIQERLVVVSGGTTTVKGHEDLIYGPFPGLFFGQQVVEPSRQAGEGDVVQFRTLAQRSHKMRHVLPRHHVGR
ncbi:hypothetical protein JDV02_007038 [Purpureocillium takamizusanense]|uniref:Uncharacterized protein n=1 Tax=Purpureocillium takamizusanense TaxID=2060973 RepID=A0A9Q8VBX8_9HYPO|nr:uncharacterized protein JDV02_007038 [Purpureocillium takamizusanense]UNI21005.1 hypothetical protein JDV02_007038 [Purpureocillium takamizusanense]